MKTIINIRSLTIAIPNQEESKQPVKSSYQADGNYRPLNKETAVDGVYIYTGNGNLWLPQFWGLSEEVPQSVVVIKGEKKLCISLKGSLNNMMMLDSEKQQKGKCYESLEDALNDWDGWKNTEELCKVGSPAGKYCKELGNKWYIPTLGELNFIQKNKNLIDSALTICGGEPFFYGWHWTSTRRSDNCYWVLDWGDGSRYNDDLNLFNRVRPVSAFL